MPRDNGSIMRTGSQQETSPDRSWGIGQGGGSNYDGGKIKWKKEAAVKGGKVL